MFEEEAKKIGKVDFLVQGTIYPDVIESGVGRQPPSSRATTMWAACRIMWISRRSSSRCAMLFKDEVRQLGRELGLPEYLVMRQPFPGPGLAIRIIGDVTKEKLDILRDADAIFREEMRESRPGQKRQPVFCRPDQHAFRGRHGRWPHLRLYSWPCAPSPPPTS